MKTGFIGAGKVGCSLGKYLAEYGVNIIGYYDQDEKAALEGAQFTATRVYSDMGELVSDCDCVFITVPDSLISGVFDQIKTSDIKGKIICHCSGSLSAREAFAGIEDTGAYGYSVHPLFAVSDRFETYRELGDAFFTIEGDDLKDEKLSDSRSLDDDSAQKIESETQISDIRRMLEDAGLKVKVIRPEDKAKYHLAAVIVSNLVLALVDSGVEKLKECGFAEEDALVAVSPLAKGNMEHAVNEGVVRSLTGPVERGDVKTLQKHLEQITDPEEKELYILLSRRLLDIGKRKNPDRDYRDMEIFLERAKGIDRGH